jgi:Putative TOS1-like glycosyl hydrolase (DUF2401)/Glycine-rich protein domain (DUF2403)
MTRARPAIHPLFGLVAAGTFAGLAMCSSSPGNVAPDGGAPSGKTGDAGGAGATAPGSDGGSSQNVPATGDDASAANGGDAGSAIPASCAAADLGNTPLGTDTPDPTGTAVAAITYTNVGATGSYDRVVTSTVAPSCTPNVCQKTSQAESGPLTPFDEEMTMVFSGPMDLYQVATYAPGSGGNYQRVAYWDPCTTEGLAWVGNKAWYQCNGYVQSYVTDDGTAESPTPVQFAGHLDPGVGVNVMSDVPCTGTTDGSDCGFSRGLALHGFKGDAAGSKIFVTKFRMPLGNVTPAYWVLPAQVVRSAQYGCNCRGEGGDGGCGELDVAEVLGGNTANPAHPEQATTTIYSFQGVTNGGTSYFQRPVYETATFVVIFDAPSSSIAMRRLGPADFDFATTLPATLVGQWLANRGTARAMP